MTDQGTETRPRVLGHRDGLGDGPVEISTWIAPTPGEAATRPALPAPPPRPKRTLSPSAQPPTDGSSIPTTDAPRERTTAAKQRGPRPEWVKEDSVQAMIWARPEDAARLVRTILLEPAGADDDLPPTQRVAILFISLGQEISGEVLKYLSDYEIEETTQAVARMKTVSAEMQAQVLADAEQHLLAGRWIGQGGLVFAQGALERAVGPRKAKEILDRVASVVSSGFALLRSATPEQVSPFLSYEHPQTVALILSQLEPSLGAGILALLAQELQIDVAHRIATMREVKPAALKVVEEGIEAQLRDIIGGTYDVGGPKVLADLLNLSSSETEGIILAGMEAADPQATEAVKTQMFTYADIETLDDADLDLLLSECDFDDCVVALKATHESLKARIQQSVGDEAWQKLARGMEARGPMRASDVELVQLRMVKKVRQLEEQGRITVVRAAEQNPLV